MAISLVSIVAAVMARGHSAAAVAAIVLTASILFLAGLALFVRGKGYSFLSVAGLLIGPTVVVAFLPWPAARGAGGLATVALIALLPDRSVRNKALRTAGVKSDKEPWTAKSSKILNGWQRLGILLSALWVVGVLVYALCEAAGVAQSGAFMASSWKIPPDAGNGIRLSAIEVKRTLVLGRLSAAMVVPVVIAWALAYAGMTAWRWVGSGFKES